MKFKSKFEKVVKNEFIGANIPESRKRWIKEKHGNISKFIGELIEKAYQEHISVFVPVEKESIIEELEK